MHGFYGIPINIMLVVTYINAMDEIVFRYVDAKSRVPNKFWTIKIIGDIICSRSGDGQQQYRQYKNPENIFSFFRQWPSVILSAPVPQICINCQYAVDKVFLNDQRL